jgi:hypothetical protein
MRNDLADAARSAYRPDGRLPLVSIGRSEEAHAIGRRSPRYRSGDVPDYLGGVAVRPPDCFICQRSLRDGEPYSSFTDVWFALTPEEEAIRREQDRQGWVGHPPEVEWFCDKHSALAEEHAHLHWREALELLARQRGQLGEAR